MPAIDPSALRSAIGRREFAPVYCVHGDDDHTKDAAVRHLVDAAVDAATRDFNRDVRRGAELDAEAVESLLNTLPMMAERRVVVVRDVGALKKDARQAVDRYLAHPSPDTVAVLVAAAGTKVDKTLADRTTTVEFAPLTGRQVGKWIVQHAASDFGAAITEGAAALLQGAVGDDLPQLAAELDKLASYTNGGEIDEAAVADVVGVRRGETLGDLLDRVAMREPAEALALVAHVMAQPKMGGVPIVMALSVQTLAIAHGVARRAEGVPAAAMFNEFMTLLKTTGAFPMRPWGDACKGWANAVGRWSSESCDRALAALLDADAALKGVDGARISNDEQIVSSLVLALCAPDPVRRASRPHAA
jgi:DNA polymerase-3 subunit delta